MKILFWWLLFLALWLIASVVTHITLSHSFVAYATACGDPDIDPLFYASCGKALAVGTLFVPVLLIPVYALLTAYMRQRAQSRQEEIDEAIRKDRMYTVHRNYGP